MPRLPDIKLPDIKFPKWDQIPEPIIYAPELEYPVLNWPSVAPRAAGKPPADKPRQAKQKPVPRRKGNDNTEPGSGSEVTAAKEQKAIDSPIDTPEKVVTSIVEQITPTLTLQAESINTLQQQIWDIQSDVQVEIEELQDTFETQEVAEVTVPMAGWVVPLPKPAILVTAGTTAGVSVGATLTATWAFKRSVQVFKPIITAVIKKIRARMGKPTQTWSRKRLEQRRRKSAHKD